MGIKLSKKLEVWTIWPSLRSVSVLLAATIVGVGVGPHHRRLRSLPPPFRALRPEVLGKQGKHVLGGWFPGVVFGAPLVVVVVVATTPQMILLLLKAGLEYVGQYQRQSLLGVFVRRSVLQNL